MKHVAVSSSQIQSVGYDPASQTMEVKFKAGVTYSYKGVSEKDHAALMSADSVGKHFQANIRGKFEHKKH